MIASRSERSQSSRKSLTARQPRYVPLVGRLRVVLFNRASARFAAELFAFAPFMFAVMAVVNIAHRGDSARASLSRNRWPPACRLSPQPTKPTVTRSLGAGRPRPKAEAGTISGAADAAAAFRN